MGGLEAVAAELTKPGPAAGLRAALHAAQKKLSLPDLTWYQSTRHTFASHWVMDGRPNERSVKVLAKRKRLK